MCDATRISDDKLVYIKRISTYPREGHKQTKNEGEIAQIFSESAVRKHPHNHCVPVLDLFPDDEEESISYLVMPFLRRSDDPPFDRVNDIVELADQLMEVCILRAMNLKTLTYISRQGLVFMHVQGVAHRFFVHLFLCFILC